MRKKRFFCFVLVSLLIFGAASTAMAESEVKPINLSLFTPVQIFDETYSIQGFRLNLIYGVNAVMRGLDIGFINEVRDYGSALQIGVANLAGGDFKGWQISGVNIVNGSFHGLQTALFNSAKEMRGLQIGAINMTDNLHGLQIGVLNFNWSGDPLTFFPIINWSF